MKVPPILLLFILVLSAAIDRADGQPNEQGFDTIVSHIPRGPVDSSGIAAIGYSKRLHALEIEFVNGAVYRYLEVPASLYRELLAADSKARFYDRNIRGRFRSVHVRSRKPK
jgi:hypothetical protein